MRKTDQLRESFGRLVALGVAVAATWLVADLPPQGMAVRVSLMALLATFVLGVILPRRLLTRETRIGILSLDLVAIATIGCGLVAGSIPDTDARSRS